MADKIFTIWMIFLINFSFIPYTWLFKSPSGNSELDCATTKSDTAERNISIGRESLKFFVLGALAYLQIPPLGCSRDEKWRAQWIRKRSVCWNLSKLFQIWLCNGDFGPCTAQNHLRTKQFVSGTWNSRRVAACALRNEEAGRGHRPRLSSVCEKHLSGTLRSQQLARTGNCRCLTDTWSVSFSVDMHRFGVTITATVPQGSEFPQGIMKKPVCMTQHNPSKLWSPPHSSI